MKHQRQGVSIVIPAHNEAAMIERCLGSILSGTTRPVEAIVACNGCTDGTEAIAAAFDPRVKVVVSPVASKHAALNLGDATATHSLRCYVDADVELSSGAIDAVADQLESGRSIATAPRIRFERAGGRLGWSYLQVWEANPYFQHGLIGSGFYAFGPEGRSRFDRFPPIVADDMFVYGLFDDAERATTDGATFTPLMPENIRDAVRVHLRHYGAHQQMRHWAAETRTRVDLPSVGGLGWLRTQWRNPVGIVAYLAVKLIAQAGGRLKYRFGDMQKWERSR